MEKCTFCFAFEGWLLNSRFGLVLLHLARVKLAAKLWKKWTRNLGWGGAASAAAIGEARGRENLERVSVGCQFLLFFSLFGETWSFILEVIAHPLISGFVRLSPSRNFNFPDLALTLRQGVGVGRKISSKCITRPDRCSSLRREMMKKKRRVSGERRSETN